MTVLFRSQRCPQRGKVFADKVFLTLRTPSPKGHLVLAAMRSVNKTRQVHHEATLWHDVRRCLREYELRSL